MIFLRCILAPLVAFSFTSTSFGQEKRLALIMGVGDYKGTKFQTLPGIDKDLQKMEAALKATGFLVTVVENPTLSTAEDAIDTFGARLKAQKDAVGLFYFSGHGGEFEGKNYLIPRGARIGDLRDIKEQAVAAQRVLNRMEVAGTRVNIVFLDCCRNDLTKAATDSGLAPMSAKGTFIGFATGTDKTSAASTDGSPYTTILAKRLLTPGVSILDMHTQVTADVEDLTKAFGAEQTPFQYSGLRLGFFFVPGQAKSPDFEAELQRRVKTEMARLTPSASVAAPTPELSLSAATKETPFINSLGMEFVPVPGTKVLFCRWETRVKDYRAYARNRSGVDSRWENPSPTKAEISFAQTEYHPVVCVNWDDARAFCDWLSVKEGRKYRLPTDGEWSAAAGLRSESGDTPSAKDGKVAGYPWGLQWPPPKGVGNIHPDLKVDDFEKTSPVGSFAANELGIFDLLGNACEWCEDYYDVHRYLRVQRGVSWARGTVDDLKSSHRGADGPSGRSGDNGFRCVLVLTER